MMISWNQRFHLLFNFLRCRLENVKSAEEEIRTPEARCATGLLEPPRISPRCIGTARKDDPCFGGSQGRRLGPDLATSAWWLF